jgi:hypothetical protein
MVEQVPAAMGQLLGSGSCRAFGHFAQTRLRRFRSGLLRLWDDIKSLFDLLANPREKLRKTQQVLSDIEIDKLYAASKESIASGLLILSDEPLMFIYVSAIVAWVGMLPPQVVVDVMTAIASEFLINVLVGICLTGGAGIAVRAGTKVLSTVKSVRRSSTLTTWPLPS